jgi:hypothetical protein
MAGSAIDGALRAGVDPKAIFISALEVFDGGLSPTVRSAIRTGDPASEKWVAAQLERRRAHYSGIAEKLGIPEEEAERLAAPKTDTIRVVPSTVTIVDAPRRP